MDSPKKVTSNGISNDVNKPVSEGVTICDMRPTLAAVASDVLKVSDLFPGKMDDWLCLQQGMMKRKVSWEFQLPNIQKMLVFQPPPHP
ncbi:hypothetical protein Nepgr_028373 [Nepenthes gracilis]|uniref:Uncharacterized protein n=1 Tax=Nepenthes gracilis TaxID=150966 RepID=A0AAD3TBK3_NEPGR|nr:hypothetical protein Nepgr_028373 [Nepenthes gracilis]